MNRKSKSLATIAGSAFVAVMVFAQVPGQEGHLFCSSSHDISFDHELPMSHPANRCAAEQSSDVSWSSWFSGRSSSYQFHYLDLLELLYTGSEEPKKTSPRP